MMMHIVISCLLNMKLKPVSMEAEHWLSDLTVVMML